MEDVNSFGSVRGEQEGVGWIENLIEYGLDKVMIEKV